MAISTDPRPGTNNVEREPSRSTGDAMHWPHWLLHGIRPFFVAAAVFSVIALAVWIVMLRTGLALPSRFDPLSWHVHEMLFGFVMAAISGFILTALPNWTQRTPISGLPLALMAGLWLLGRLGCLFSARLPLGVAIAVDLSLPCVLILAATREIFAARNWRNLPVIGTICVLGTANLLMHLEAAGVGIPPGLGWRLAVAATLILISVIAGRIVPSYTRTWLDARRSPPAHPPVRFPPDSAWLDAVALITLHAGILAWAIAPAWHGSGWLLIAGALSNGCRVARWRGLASRSEPMLFVLHVAYAWLVLGTGLLALTILGLGLPPAAAIHALTVGAIGSMILAVMTRATRVHCGRVATADNLTLVIYVCISLAAVVRMLAAYAATLAMLTLLVATCLWATAFTLFVYSYGPLLLRRRRSIGREARSGTAR